MFNLSTETEKRFNQLEKIIEKGMTHFVEVGTALSIIRNEKLYRVIFQTFEEYCKERWGFNSSRARQLISAAQINENIKSVTTVTPASERQARPLISLEPEQQKKVWKKAVETAPEGKVTAKHVENVVEGLAMARPEENIVEGEFKKDEADEIVEDTIVLKQLKKYWSLADSYDKELFIKWIEEEKR